MSISNLFRPNDYDLYCDTLTANSFDVDTITMDHLIIGSTGAQSQPAITINNTNTFNNTDIIQINCQNPSSKVTLRNTNPASVSNSFVTENDAGLIKLQCGNNNSDGTAFVYTQNHADLKIGTHGVERLRILETGIPTSVSTNALVLNGVTLSTNNSFPPGSTGTFNVNFTGAITSSNVTIAFQKVGNGVIMRIPLFTNAFVGPAGSIVATGSQIPANIRPDLDYTFACQSFNNGAFNATPAQITITTTGNITLWNGWGTGADFTAGNIGLFSNFACSYLTT